MSALDGALLATILGLGGWRLLNLRRTRRRWIFACAAVAVLAGLQGALVGFTWQFLTGYLLLAAVALPGTGPAGGWVVRGAVAALMLLALAPWALLPVPPLPKPDGPYAVGTRTFRWVDMRRPEDATDDPADHRNVIVQAWYPAAAKGGGAQADYMDGLGRLPGRVTLFPAFVFRRFDRIDTHATEGAPVSGTRPRWPVVVFSPGYGAPRAFYTGLVSRLASRGYVVLALDHPYEAAVVALADGRIAAPVPVRSGDKGYMPRQQGLRAADVRFVLDQLARPGAIGPVLAPRLDLEHIAAIGHSFGGATAVEALAGDRRLAAAANLDGTVYGDVPGRRLDRPFLLLQSDRAETGHSDKFLQGNARLLAGAAPGWAYEIPAANHYSFTDAPLFFSPPGRWAMARLMGGGRGAAETQAAATDVLDAFLRGPLTGRPASVERAAAKGGLRPARLGLAPGP